MNLYVTFCRQRTKTHLNEKYLSRPVPSKRQASNGKFIRPTRLVRPSVATGSQRKPEARHSILWRHVQPADARRPQDSRRGGCLGSLSRSHKAFEAPLSCAHAASLSIGCKSHPASRVVHALRTPNLPHICREFRQRRAPDFFVQLFPGNFLFGFIHRRKKGTSCRFKVDRRDNSGVSARLRIHGLHVCCADGLHRRMGLNFTPDRKEASVSTPIKPVKECIHARQPGQHKEAVITFACVWPGRVEQ